MFDILPEEGIFYDSDLSSVKIKGVSLDSRVIEKGFLFIALRGHVTDGHRYIGKAIEQGAIAILCKELPEFKVKDVVYIRYLEKEKIAGEVASRFYDYPSRNLKVVGITGTNGKSSCVTMLHDLVQSLGYKGGVISTIANKIGKEVIPAQLTTPDPITLHRLLREMVDSGCEYAFMEVSSHAMVQGRVAGIEFVGGAFTNITQDHLDYHRTMKAYIAAKKSFFDRLGKDAFALSNKDDKNGEVMLQNCIAHKKYFGLRHACDYKGKILSNDMEGLFLDVNTQRVHFNLSGAFNAYNILTVYGIACELGLEKEEVLVHMSGLKHAEGRFEKILGNPEGKIGIVDYAHTPDALDNVLDTIKEVKNREVRTITVVGCGGNRDKVKRPLMAQIAALKSDQIILTSDNPRNEDPDTIIDDMEEGLNKELKNKTLRITDRKEAIRTACRLARSGDIILVAGKGHETYQEIKGKKFPFDDKKILIAELLKDI
ncbi:MAG: UDP-N-acetylmuramoyl-L-alanyl-D-glutamate--2,6-diaminopimelate ligase [Saprospiraceae bacterium]|nr:UDP-N-acetylmuramoyl-L-alanyl-D-glutamate--2,6-diaminopimelate ligase [Saprospiraceae bacterium]